MPVVNAHVGTIWVELNGPPCVSTYATAMSVAVKTIPNRSATIAIGSWSGRLTYQNFFSPVAPSTAAASSTSRGIDAMPAMKITVANGRIRHECTAMIESFARVGSPTQFGGLVSEQFWMFVMSQ